jgi:transposase
MDAKQYRSILKHYMAPYLKQFGEEMKCEVIFQQDNDPKHTSKIAKQYLENKKIVVLDWPSQSPDMNPIEHAWKTLKEKITDRQDKASNLDDVFEIATEEWNKLPLEFFRNLISSMPNRVRALYTARGRHTKY